MAGMRGDTPGYVMSVHELALDLESARQLLALVRARAKTKAMEKGGIGLQLELEINAQENEAGVGTLVQAVRIKETRLDRASEEGTWAWRGHGGFPIPPDYKPW